MPHCGPAADASDRAARKIRAARDTVRDFGTHPHPPCCHEQLHARSPTAGRGPRRHTGQRGPRTRRQRLPGGLLRADPPLLLRPDVGMAGRRQRRDHRRTVRGPRPGDLRGGSDAAPEPVDLGLRCAGDDHHGGDRGRLGRPGRRTGDLRRPGLVRDRLHGALVRLAAGGQLGRLPDPDPATRADPVRPGAGCLLAGGRGARPRRHGDRRG